MRLFFIFILTVITFQSCSPSSDDSPNTNQGGNNMSMTNDGMGDNNNDTGNGNNGTGNGNETSGVAYQGDFVSAAHETKGTAAINSSKTILSFTNFKTDSGPILDVYLATDTNATNYVDLGVLKGLEGNYDYDLPTNIDFTTYKYVIIWCVDYSINFGYAVLE